LLWGGWRFRGGSALPTVRDHLHLPAGDALAIARLLVVGQSPRVQERKQLVQPLGPKITHPNNPPG
jgi:hypothetical protein